jgi:hypothetical protein
MNVEIIHAAVIEIPYACNAHAIAIDYDARHNRNIRPPGPIVRGRNKYPPHNYTEAQREEYQ